MAAEQSENAQTASDGSQSDASLENETARERSSIEFPYNDLDDAVEIARAIHTNAGTSCSLSQLAAFVDQSVGSGAFRLRVSNARTFGLTENERREVRLTSLGRTIADPAQESMARVDAFLHVPLYQRIFDHHDGYTLPGAAPLERFMREVGVSSKQTGKARQAFMRSARQAGFFAHGEDRLVRPAFPGGPGTRPIGPAPSEDDPNKAGSGGSGGGGGDRTDIDPIIKGLLVRLPKSGDVWPEPERKLWLGLLEGSFKLIYKDAPEREARSHPAFAGGSNDPASWSSSSEVSPPAAHEQGGKNK